MLSRSRFLRGLATLVTVACLGGTANAGLVDGTQAISDIGSTSANASTISAATIFNLASLISTGSNTGDFAANGAAGLLLGSATLDITNPAAFSFGSAAFGTFTASSIVILPGSATSVSFYLLGTFDPGTIFPAGLQDIGPASFTLGFTQTGGPDSAISASGTLAVPPAPFVPEPTTLVSLATGLLVSAFLVRRRRTS